MRLNESAVFIATVVGLLLGAGLGFGIGILAAALWWWRLAARSRSSGALAACARDEL